MKRNEYIRYCNELKANGYTFMNNVPYDGRSVWMKEIRNDTSIHAYIVMHLYLHNDEFGNDIHKVDPTAIMETKAITHSVRTNIAFDTTDISEIERVTREHIARLT